MPIAPPSRIETPRLVLRPWSADDAPALQRVVLHNLGHLRAWMPWATEEAHERVEDVAERLARFGDDFAAGHDFGYVMTERDGGALVGAVGLHPRVGPDALEIGYWVRADREGRGYVTEAVRAVVDAAFATCDVERLEIRCDPRNVRSSAVAARAGFRHVDTRFTHVELLAEERETMVWELTREERVPNT
jgi:RimJ/RimL family protein N-acetyltransferase